jgi:hypothetical protein
MHASTLQEREFKTTVGELDDPTISDETTCTTFIAELAKNFTEFDHTCGADFA